MLGRLAPFWFVACLFGAEEVPLRVRGLITAHCAQCHTGAKAAAGLDLAEAAADSPAWGKVLDRVNAGTMPPRGLRRPAAADTDLLRQWITRDQSARRVTAHRLNRVEYDHTVRDLLGVDLHAALDDFPLDDAGYGFDNIADVLSVSPLLMEKYLAAAKRISQAAIHGAAVPAKPTKLIRFMTKKSQEDPTPRTLPFANRGALDGRFWFPVTGTYELRMRVGNYRPRVNGTPRQKELSAKRNRTAAEQRELDEENRRAYPPVKMILTFDGTPVLEEIVEGNIDYQYAHGESIARVKVTAGEHHFRASFPEFAELDNPLDNMNLDGRRKLFIDYLDVVGPFQPTPMARPRFFVCAEKTAACGDRIITELAWRAYRGRAVDPKPLHKLAAMVRDSGDGFEESIRVAVQAMLVSPHFLFRLEDDLPSKLSYFLWSSMPDDELLAAAPRLREPAVLEAQVRRMLAHPKAKALVDNFAGQWLGLRQLDKRKPDPKVFPRVDDELLDAMRQETLLFTAAIVREDRSVFDFLDGRFSYLNGPLARHYGISGVEGESFRRVEFTNAQQRGGVWTQAAVLTQASYATRTSPVLRGRWVLENLLGTPPPPPPPDVPALEEGEIGKSASLRQRLEQHRAKPACAVCHDQMDPIGFQLENYDASGAWRDRDGAFPIDASGPAELRRTLAAKREVFYHNFSEKLLTYALGRGVEPADRAALEQIEQSAAAQGHRFSALVLAIVKSPVFLGGAP